MSPPRALPGAHPSRACLPTTHAARLAYNRRLTARALPPTALPEANAPPPPGLVVNEAASEDTYPSRVLRYMYGKHECILVNPLTASDMGKNYTRAGLEEDQAPQSSTGAVEDAHTTQPQQAWTPARQPHSPRSIHVLGL